MTGSVPTDARYTYELCFFGKATQKNNRDGSSNHLGWVKRTATLTPALSHSGKRRSPRGHLTTTRGSTIAMGGGLREACADPSARCWNGPMRSVTVDLTCGTTNTILSISEPEKCEYHMKATSPALCWPLDPELDVKEEL